MSVADLPATATVSLSINGIPVTVGAGATIYEAAAEAGIDIPVLCHDPRMSPVGVCRMCVVDIGGRVLAASCVRAAEEGMKVETTSAKVETHRAMLTSLLMSDHPTPCAREQATADCELEALARKYSAPSAELLPRGGGRKRDLSSKVIAVDHQSCILCDRCIRGCDEIQNNDVIGRSGKGYTTTIAFDLDQPMGESTCVSCGECMAVCPTGALVNKKVDSARRPHNELENVKSVCPYCGVGCAVTLHVDKAANRIVEVSGRESVVNHERLCVKGRYGFDYSSHPQRLTKPLIRKESSYPKGPLSDAVRIEHGHKPGGIVDYDQVMPHFREATWEEALDLAASKLSGIRDTLGGKALAGFGSAKCSNEEAYLFQKMLRAVWGTNNIDHCTRLCHASSVAALLETIGSGAVTNVFADVARSDVALITGSNATANHPVAATFMKEAAARGTKLIVIDPRRPTLADHAHFYIRLNPSSDVAFYNSIMHVILEHKLEDRAFIENRTEGFAALKAMVANYPPEVASKICGITPQKIIDVALTIGRAKAMLIFWGMGISQHTHGTDNARSLISLCLLTGNVGRPGTGLHPLRGQNNVQGASDAGLIPMVFPDYQSVADEKIRNKFESAWGVPLDPKPGLTVVEIVHAILDGKIKGMYMLGENPFISDPNTNKVRKALSTLDFLVVQDIFLTETAEFADVILPATSYMEKTGTYTNTDRRVQIGRQALVAPGEARLDWKITQDLANRMGAKWNYTRIEEIFDEFASLTESYKTLSYDNLGETGKLWPCPDPENEDGIQVLFDESFPSGRGKFVPCAYAPARELPDAEYPFVLNTGRMLEHWHTGTMTRRSKALDAIQPEALCEMHPDDLERLGITPGSQVEIASRRGAIVLKVNASRSVSVGGVFVPFHFREANANSLTTDALDPIGKIPEFKFCAVKVKSAT